MRGERGMSDVVETTSDEDGGAQRGGAKRERKGSRGAKRSARWKRKERVRGCKGLEGCKGRLYYSSIEVELLAGGDFYIVETTGAESFVVGLD